MDGGMIGLYDSGIAAKDFIRSVAEEADITVTIAPESWVRWLNTVEQFVYTEIFRELVSYTTTVCGLEETVLPLARIPVLPGAAPVAYDDLVKVYVNHIELDKTSVTSSLVFRDKPLYYTDYGGNLCLSLSAFPCCVTVVHLLRPALKEVDSKEPVRLPVEFVDLAAARMRGEAYKIANEDGLSAKWLSDYNTQMENLKLWAAARKGTYGE